MNSETRSPIIMVVTLVLARMQSGMMDASTTRMFSRPCTLPYWLTTAMGSEDGPILQVQEMCCAVETLLRSQWSNASSDSRSESRGLDALLDDVLEIAVLAQLDGDADAVAQALAVELLLEVVVVEVGLLVRVGGVETQLAGADGEIDGHGGADAHGLHATAATNHLLGGEGREDHDHVVAQVGALGRVLETRLDAGREPVEVKPRYRAPGYGDDGMVAEVLADAGSIVDDGDAHAAEVVSRADAGKHQELGRGDCAAAEDDLVGFDGEHLAAAFDHHAGGAVAVEDDAVDGAVGP